VAVLEKLHEQRGAIGAQIDGFGELADQNPGLDLKDTSQVGGKFAAIAKSLPSNHGSVCLCPCLAESSLRESFRGYFGVFTIGEKLAEGRKS
jgi:hypothetical protein